MKQVGIGGAHPYKLKRVKRGKGGIGGAKHPLTSLHGKTKLGKGYKLPKVRIPQSRLNY